MLQPSEQNVLVAYQDAMRREEHQLAAEDEGGAVAPRQRYMLTDAEIELKVPPPRPEPYGQAGAPPATNMKMVRAIDRQIPRLEYGGWDMAEVADLCFEVLRRVRDDTEAREAAGQKPQVLMSLPHLIFEDTELVRIFTDRRRDVGLGPVSVEPEPWPPGQTEGDRLDSMREEAGLTSAQLQVVRAAGALLVRHELGWRCH